MKRIRARRLVSYLGLTALFTGVDAGWAATEGCVPAPSGLVSWWRGEHDPSDYFTNSTSTVFCGVTFTNGVVGAALNFNGVCGHIRVPDCAALRFTNALTVEGWINPCCFDGPRGIAVKWGAVPGFAATQLSYSFFLEANGHLALELSGTGATSPTTKASTPKPVARGEWTHVAGTYDGTSIRVYVNGVLEREVAYSGGIFPGKNDLAIGANVGGLPQGLVLAPFAGSIDELSLYGRALDTEEIRKIYQAGEQGKCPRPSGPVIATQPQGQIACWGGSVSFKAGALPNPLPVAYQWQKDGSPVAGATRPTLAITNVDVSDAGHFELLMTNSMGTVTSYPALLVVNAAGVTEALTPTLTIRGTPGKRVAIQYTTRVSDTSVWYTLTNLTITESDQLWFDRESDANSEGQPRRHYRVIPAP
jgi:hypothetical protein